MSIPADHAYPEAHRDATAVHTRLRALPSLSASAVAADFAPGEMTGPSARVLADSYGPDGTRIITFETVMHRWILAENNTHRSVSKCAGSSRAVPVEKQVDRMRKHPALPVHYGQEQKGMQAHAEIGEEAQTLVRHRWIQAMERMIREVGEMRALGLHKQVANRLLEPYTYIRVVQTATAWDNLLDLRDHPDAQPEFQALATLMRRARDASQPVALAEGQFHLPYISERDRDEVTDRLKRRDPLLLARTFPDGTPLDVERILARMSSARCARTSYLTLPVVGANGAVIEEAKVNIAKDFSTSDDLISAQPRHWSPFEHQATPWPANRQWEPVPFFVPDGRGGVVEKAAKTDHLPRIGNLLAFRSQRTELETLLGEVTFR